MAFCIKNMNFISNRLSVSDNILICLFEDLRMPISTVCLNCFMKFNELIADWFFSLEEINKVWKKKIQSLGLKSPSARIFEILFFGFNKSQRASESQHQPIEKQFVCVSYLKRDAINIIRPIFGKPFLYSEAAFSIDKASNIGEFFFFWSYAWANIFELLCVFIFNNVQFMLKFSNVFNESHAMFYSRIIQWQSFIRIYVQSIFIPKLRFMVLSYEIWLNCLTKFNRFLVFNSPNIWNSSVTDNFLLSSRSF